MDIKLLLVYPNSILNHNPTHVSLQIHQYYFVYFCGMCGHRMDVEPIVFQHATMQNKQTSANSAFYIFDNHIQSLYLVKVMLFKQTNKLYNTVMKYNDKHNKSIFKLS